MLDVQLRRIVPKAAGTYFIVRDNSQVEEIQNENKMRLFFINVEQGPINVAVSFAKGDTDGFKAVFGRGNRQMLKNGNFSIQTCLDALEGGPITVVNLRTFDNEKDKCDVTGLNPNNTKINGLTTKSVSYTKLFNTNTFWTPNYNKMNDIVENCLLNFANVGNTPFSIFVTYSKYVNLVTSQGDETLASCSMEIDEYPAIDFNTLVKDTIVDVYLFNNTFDKETVSTNQYYGHLFYSNGRIVFDRINELCSIPEAGFVKVFTGSLIPNLKNEQGDEISINTVVNQYFMETGLICDINDDIFEIERQKGSPLIDASGFSFFTESGDKKEDVSSNNLSHIVPDKLTIDIDGCDITSQAGYIKVEKVATDESSFITTYGSGIRYGNSILGKDNVVSVISIEIVEDVEELTDDTKIKVYCNGPVKFSSISESKKDSKTETVASDIKIEFIDSVSDELKKESSINGNIITFNKLNNNSWFKIKINGTEYGSIKPKNDHKLSVESEQILTNNQYEDILFENIEENQKYQVIITSEGDTFKAKLVKYNDDSEKEIDGDFVVKYNDIFATSQIEPTTLNAYTPRKEQFIDGSSNRQKEILDMINNPGIVKGLTGVRGLRYVVDCFKSFVEGSYKSQYGQLMTTLDEKNRFVRFIGNDVFVKDLQNSTNPSFKDVLNNFNLSYLQDGGNRDVSTKLLTKFATGDEFCFFFGPEKKINNIEVGIAGNISNLFYQKENAFDVVANTTGVVDGITELGYTFDDDERMYCEQFRYNPVIYLRNSYRIYGNLTAKASKTAQQQITNSELLAYIKENLYNISMTENFKRGTYDDYLRTETQCKEFMSSLVLAGVIDADFICECNTTNNTLEIRKQKIKLVHIEYTPVDVLEKVVFDLTIN